MINDITAQINGLVSPIYDTSSGYSNIIPFLFLVSRGVCAGASDCAGCVGVALEVARALVADPTKSLAAPAVFLFNGGEELVLLAAHGFMNQSRHAPHLAAFINLESAGPGGPSVLFQASGAPCLRSPLIGVPRAMPCGVP